MTECYSVTVCPSGIAIPALARLPCCPALAIDPLPPSTQLNHTTHPLSGITQNLLKENNFLRRFMEMIYSITWSNIAVSWKWEIMETEFRVNDSVCNWLEIQASPPCVDVDVGQHDIMM